jgi:hypothetical protein
MSPKYDSFLRDVVGTIFGSKNGVPDYDDESSQERRSQSREGRRLPIQFYDPTKSTSHQGVLINGSGGGAFIETNDTLPLLTTIRIEGPGLIFHAEVCRVHWLNPEERVSRSSGMAVRLLSGSSQFEDADYESDEGQVLNIANARVVTV